MATTDDKARPHLKWDQYFDPHQAEIFVSRWRYDGEYPQHDHDFLEIVLCVGGENRHCSVRGDEAFVAGDVYVLRPGTWHVMAGRKIQAYNCCFGMKLLWGELHWTLEDARLNPLLWSGPLSHAANGILHLHLDSRRRRQCQQLLDQMLKLGNQRDPRLHARRIGLVTLFLSNLADALPQPQHSPVANHPAALDILRQLNQQLAHNWTINELCDITQLEQSYLTRLFRQTTGLPPMAYLARLRAEKAASMLLRTALPISDIALAVGWDDPNYFARRFRRHYGLSASAYRSQFSSIQPSGPGAA